jgi:hypothetical protein
MDLPGCIYRHPLKERELFGQGEEIKAVATVTQSSPASVPRSTVKRQAGRNAPRVLAFFLGGDVVERARRAGLLSMAARKMRLMRVW